MQPHPAFAVGDVLLLRGNPFAGSVVVEGYDGRVLRWSQPSTEAVGFGPAAAYVRAPDHWQDAPRPISYIEDAAECRGRLIEFHTAMIGWASRHLVRIDTGLAAHEVWNSRAQLECLRSVA